MKPGEAGHAVILSSLPLQILVYFDGWYSAFYFLINICLYIYKDYKYYFPSKDLGLELSCVCLYALLQWARLFSTSKGNKTEALQPLLLSLVLTVPVVLLYVFLLCLQTYVLRVDIIVGSIAVAFAGLESLLACTTAWTFHDAYHR
ncbi:unnamed protein product [Phaeothamnion confervicola]